MYGMPLVCALGMGVCGRLAYALVFAVFGGADSARPYFANMAALIAAIAVSVLIYFVLLLKSGTFTASELESLPRGRSIVRLAKRMHLIR